MSEKKEFLAVDVHGGGVLGQVGQNKQFHAILRYLAVGSDIAAGDSGIDRYLSGVTSSRREGNQVHGRLAALALDMLQGLRRQIDLHQLPLQPVSPSGTLKQ